MKHLLIQIITNEKLSVIWHIMFSITQKCLLLHNVPLFKYKNYKCFNIFYQFYKIIYVKRSIAEMAKSKSILLCLSIMSMHTTVIFSPILMKFYRELSYVN